MRAFVVFECTLSTRKIALFERLLQTLPDRMHKLSANRTSRVEGLRASPKLRSCKTGRSPETVGLIVSNGSQVMEFAPPTEVHIPKKRLETSSRWSLLGGVR